MHVRACICAVVIVIFYFFIGNELLHKLTTSRKYKLRIELMDFSGASRFAQYSTFSVGSRDSGYKLSVGGYSGNAGMRWRYLWCGCVPVLLYPTQGVERPLCNQNRSSILSGVKWDSSICRWGGRQEEHPTMKTLLKTVLFIAQLLTEVLTRDSTRVATRVAFLWLVTWLESRTSKTRDSTRTRPLDSDESRRVTLESLSYR